MIYCAKRFRFRHLIIMVIVRAKNVFNNAFWTVWEDTAEFSLSTNVCSTLWAGSGAPTFDFNRIRSAHTGRGARNCILRIAHYKSTLNVAYWGRHCRGRGCGSIINCLDTPFNSNRYWFEPSLHCSQAFIMQKMFFMLKDASQYAKMWKMEPRQSGKSFGNCLSQHLIWSII